MMRRGTKKSNVKKLRREEERNGIFFGLLGMERPNKLGKGRKRKKGKETKKGREKERFALAGNSYRNEKVRREVRN